LFSSGQGDKKDDPLRGREDEKVTAFKRYLDEEVCSLTVGSLVRLIRSFDILQKLTTEYIMCRRSSIANTLLLHRCHEEVLAMKACALRRLEACLF